MNGGNLEEYVMPVHDTYHDTVKRALIKDGWTITDDPLKIRWGRRNFYVDLGAKKLLAAQKGEHKIAVEIKSFASKSEIFDLEQAVGQFAVYYDLLQETDPDRQLYVAVDNATYSTIFEEPIGQLMLQKQRLCLLVFDSTTEDILQWIP